MKKKVFLFIGAAAIVAVAAINLNVSLNRGKMPNVTLASALALANNECYPSSNLLKGLDRYKMTLITSNKQCGMAIKNSPNITTAPSYAYGLDVEQNVLQERSDNIAIRAQALSNSPHLVYYGSRAIGVYAIAGNARVNCGVYAGLKGCNNGTALFASTDLNLSQSVSGRYAGFFQGNVFISEQLGIGRQTPSYPLDVNGVIRCTSVTTTSDSRYKTNVKNMGRSLDKVAKLRPVTYNLKPEDLSEYYKLLPDTVQVKNDTELRKYFGLGRKIDDKRNRIGFIAQELEDVFPELIYSDKQGMLSIDYVSLIPVLAGAVQEQNATIEEQKRIIREQDETIRQLNEAFQWLSGRLDALENANENTTLNEKKATTGEQENNFSFTIYPNPANGGSLTVDYTIYTDASICIELYNMMGQRLKVFLQRQNKTQGAYSVQATIADLNSGTYIVKATSGNQVESKQLVIER